MKKWKILEHKADLKIKVFGKDIEELFKNTMVGMFESAKYKGEGKETKRGIKISSPDLTSLLVDFLSEVLYLSEVNREIYHEIQFKKFNDKDIEGTLVGKKLKNIGLIIKGITYHDLEVGQKKDKSWQATILFDV